jgi:hypothetical protein
MDLAMWKEFAYVIDAKFNWGESSGGDVESVVLQDGSLIIRYYDGAAYKLTAEQL